MVDVNAPVGKRVGKGKTAAKKSTSSTHPKYTEMIASAVRALKKPHGSSRQAIAKYVQNNFDLPSSGVNRHITKNIKAMLGRDELALAKGVGAAGRFKVTKKTSSTSKSSSTSDVKRRITKKRATPKKKRVVKKTVKRRSPVKKRSAKRVTKRRSSPKKGKKGRKPARKPRRR